MATRSWFMPGSCSAQRQRGFPVPQAMDQTRKAAGAGLIQVMMQSFPIFVRPPRNTLGAAGAVANFGQVGTNPIGAGVYVPHRPQASYGIAGQYIDHTIFWASQTIPTSIPISGLTDPAVLAALLGSVNVQAAVRTL